MSVFDLALGQSLARLPSLKSSRETSPRQSALQAEGVGFEPTSALRRQQFSRLPRSTTPAPLRGFNKRNPIRLLDQTFLMRTIVSGPRRLRNEGDYRAWGFELEDENRQIERVEFRLTGSAAATGESSLPPKVAEARRTEGLSIVQRLLSWDRIPAVVEACADWITLRHANGYFSRIDKHPPRNEEWLETMLESSVIRIQYRRHVEVTYRFNSPGWLKQSLQNGRAWPSEPRMLSDVIGKLSGEQRQQALDLDPQGAARLPRVAARQG
jgi:hypothetical protein